MANYGAMISLVLKAVGMAMGIVTVIISVLGAASADTMVLLLGIGVFCLGLDALSSFDDKTLDRS